MPTKTKAKRPKKTGERGVRVRMYRHGLGDCFLLRFPKQGDATYNVLIDCGLIAVAPNPKPTMQKVVQDIAKTCGGRIDAVIMTHEHWDHASGFSTQQAQAEFDKLEIGEVWYAWTEDSENSLAKKLRKERASKVRALAQAALALRQLSSPLAVERAERVESLLQFFGASNPADLHALAAGDDTKGKSRLAFEYLKHRQDVRPPRLCHPKKAPIVLPGLDDVHAYILGPPEDETLLKRSDPTKAGKEVYEFSSDLALGDSLATAFERMTLGGGEPGGPDCPFEKDVCITPPAPGREAPERLQHLITGLWDPPENAWRRIDQDWTAAAETLALNLDSHTNNTCLVVAFELGSGGPVLLFAADAQVGNWLSWQETRWRVKDGQSFREVTGPDLLSRTVFYKVGHHGSHNATLRALGLEQMTSEELVAFVPVFKEQAEKNRWHQMPFLPLVKRLKEKTGGRVVFSDTKQKAPTKANLGRLAPKEQAAFLKRLEAEPGGLYYEYVFEG